MTENPFDEHGQELLVGTLEELLDEERDWHVRDFEKDVDTEQITYRGGIGHKINYTALDIWAESPRFVVELTVKDRRNEI